MRKRLCDISQPNTADEPYHTTIKNGLPKNSYIERKIVMFVK